MSKIHMASHERILKTLAEESRWLTFDELYNRIWPGYNWIEFAELLETLVEQGSVQYVLPRGADTGYYGIKSEGNTGPANSLMDVIGK